MDHDTAPNPERAGRKVRQRTGPLIQYSSIEDRGMLESDDLLDALRSAVRSIRELALTARSGGAAATASTLSDRATELEDRVATLGPPEEWGGDFDELLSKANEADEALTDARKSLDRGEDADQAYQRAIAAAEAAIEVAAVLGGGPEDDPSRSK
jgi:hypothetical protein